MIVEMKEHGIKKDFVRDIKERKREREKEGREEKEKGLKNFLLLLLKLFI